MSASLPAGERPPSTSITCPLTPEIGVHDAERFDDNAGWCSTCARGWSPAELAGLIAAQAEGVAAALAAEDNDDHGEHDDPDGGGLDAEKFRRDFDAAAADAVAPAASAILAELAALPVGVEARLAVPILERLRDSLKSATPVERAAVRVDAVKALKGKVGAASALVDAGLGTAPPAAGAASGQGRALAFADVEPWVEEVNGAALLDDFASTFRRFVVLPAGADVALSLWALFTWVTDAFAIAPRAIINSPTKECGKSLVLDVLHELVRRALHTANISTAALFRVAEEHRPALLIDEADTIREESDDLRGLLNVGHRRGGQVIRVEGEAREVRIFDVFGPVALARIGDFRGRWDTLQSRGIVVRMRRKSAAERVESWRSDRLEQFEPLRRRATRWALDNGEALRGNDPEVPPGLSDRAADNWRPLLAIADAAGGEWAQRARSAAVALSGGEAAEDGSPGVQLLADVRALVAERDDPEYIPTSKLCAALNALDERPWGAWGRKGAGLDGRSLATMLRPFSIRSATRRLGDDTFKGYARAAFEDAWSRYLEPLPAGDPPSDPSQRHNAANTGTLPTSSSVTPPPAATDRESRNRPPALRCDGVAEERTGFATEDPTVENEEVRL